MLYEVGVHCCVFLPSLCDYVAGGKFIWERYGKKLQSIFQNNE